MNDLNIYSILSYTLTASVTAAVILLVKKIFKNKLSASWHFYIWFLLLIRLCLPVGILSYENQFSTFNIVKTSEIVYEAQNTVENVKTTLNKNSAMVRKDSLKGISPIPYLQERIRVFKVDTLLYIYLLGLFVSILYFMLIYISIRIKLRKSKRVAAHIEELTKDVRINAGVITTIPAVISDCCTSPAICGFLSPVLIIPSDIKDRVDERIIVHEIMHYKHGDIFLNVVITVFRCINWFNPVMWLVFNRIQNDCEVLCDKRVLDYYSSDERKNYGNILLTMSAKNPHFLAGTTCISNGKRNIKERIKWIAGYGKGNRYFKAIAILCAIIIVITTFTTAKAEDYDLIIFDQFFYGDYKELVKDTDKLNSIKLKTPVEALAHYGNGALGNIKSYYLVSNNLDRQELIENCSEMDLHNLNQYINVLPQEYQKKANFEIYNVYTIDGESYKGILHFKYYDGKEYYSINRVVSVKKEKYRYVCLLESETTGEDTMTRQSKLPYNFAKYKGETDNFYGEMQMDIKSFSYARKLYDKDSFARQLDQCYFWGTAAYKGDLEAISKLNYVEYRYGIDIDKQNPKLSMPPDEIVTEETRKSGSYGYGSSDGTGGGRQEAKAFIDSGMIISFGQGSSALDFIVDNKPFDAYEVEIDIGGKIDERIVLKRISMFE